MKSKCCDKEMKYFDATGIERWYECPCGKHYNADDVEIDIAEEDPMVKWFNEVYKPRLKAISLAETHLLEYHKGTKVSKMLWGKKSKLLAQAIEFHTYQAIQQEKKAWYKKLSMKLLKIWNREIKLQDYMDEVGEKSK